VGDEGVTPPQGDRDLPGPGRLGCLCRGCLVVSAQDHPDVVQGAVLPVVAVVTASRLGRDGLHHHPVGALYPGQVKQVLDGDEVAPPCAGDAPGHIIEGHLDLLQMTDALSSCSSLSLATAASAWENLPMTSP
jgi:hypothetical protein